MSPHPDGTTSPPWAVPALESSCVAAGDMEELLRQGDAQVLVIWWVQVECLWAGKVQAPPLLLPLVFSAFFCCICGVILTLLGPGGRVWHAGRSDEQPEHPSPVWDAGSDLPGGRAICHAPGSVPGGASAEPFPKPWQAQRAALHL